MGHNCSGKANGVGWVKGSLRFVLVALVVLLTGCIQYDLDIQFDSQTHGRLVQQWRWQSSAIAPHPTLDPWVQILTDRTQAVGGKIQFIGKDALKITVPFNNGKDLETRFNQFFNPSSSSAPFTLPGGEQIQAEMALRQNNWLLAIDNHIDLYLDLTAVLDGERIQFPLLQGAKLLQGNVTLTTPWGVKADDPDASAGTWPLTTGVVNHIEADFWVPSPIGIGAIAIALIVVVGYGFKYRLSK